MADYDLATNMPVYHVARPVQTPAYDNQESYQTESVYALAELSTNEQQPQKKDKSPYAEPQLGATKSTGSSYADAELGVKSDNLTTESIYADPELGSNANNTAESTYADAEHGKNVTTYVDPQDTISKIRSTMNAEEDTTMHDTLDGRTAQMDVDIAMEKNPTYLEEYDVESAIRKEGNIQAEPVYAEIQDDSAGVNKINYGKRESIVYTATTEVEDTHKILSDVTYSKVSKNISGADTGVSMGQSLANKEVPNVDAWMSIPVSKSTAEEMLLSSSNGIGSFCFRDGTEGKVLCITVTNSIVGHFRISKSDDSVQIQDLEACKGMRFPSIHHAIRYLQKTQLSEELAFRLTDCLSPPAKQAISLSISIVKELPGGYGIVINSAESYRGTFITAAKSGSSTEKALAKSGVSISDGLKIKSVNDLDCSSMDSKGIAIELGKSSHAEILLERDPIGFAEVKRPKSDMLLSPLSTPSIQIDDADKNENNPTSIMKSSLSDENRISITVVKQAIGGFGVVINSSPHGTPGTFITDITADGPMDESLKLVGLKLSDSLRIVAVNGVNTNYMDRSGVAAELGKSDTVVMTLSKDPTGFAQLSKEKGSAEQTKINLAGELPANLAPPIAEQLRESVCNNDVSTLQGFIDQGITALFGHEIGGWTLLIWAVYSGADAVLELLLQNSRNIGEDSNSPSVPPERNIVHVGQVSATDTRGNTALHWAAHTNNLTAITKLLNSCADINSINSIGSTPLHLAAARSSQDAYNLLLVKNASVSIKNKFGRLPADLIIDRSVDKFPMQRRMSDVSVVAVNSTTMPNSFKLSPNEKNLRGFGDEDIVEVKENSKTDVTIEIAPQAGAGYGIRFGVYPRQENVESDIGGLLIAGLAPESPAAATPEIEIGQQVVSINGLKIDEGRPDLKVIKNSLSDSGSGTLELTLRSNPELFKAFIETDPLRKNAPATIVPRSRKQSVVNFAMAPRERQNPSFSMKFEGRSILPPGSTSVNPQLIITKMNAHVPGAEHHREQVLFKLAKESITCKRASNPYHRIYASCIAWISATTDHSVFDHLGIDDRENQAILMLVHFSPFSYRYIGEIASASIVNVSKMIDRVKSIMPRKNAALSISGAVLIEPTVDIDPFLPVPEAHSQSATVSEQINAHRIDRSSLTALRMLGLGNFGKVFLTQWKKDDKEKTLCAVKLLRVSNQDKKGADAVVRDHKRTEFLQEAEIMQSLDHKNVCKLYGVALDSRPWMTILEHATYGDLHSMLTAFKSFHTTIPEKEMVYMSMQIARGLTYVTEKKYVHIDVAARNCLVFENTIIKIGDFGCCQKYDLGMHSWKLKSAMTLSHRWMAPEAFVSKVFSEKTDVWSFGISMWEIMTYGADPYEKIPTDELAAHISGGGRCTIPEGNEDMRSAIEQCWSSSDVRPTFKNVAADLRESLNKDSDGNITAQDLGLLYSRNIVVKCPVELD